MIRLADYVIDYLADQGVEDVFTVSGGGSIFLCDALAQSSRVRYVCCHHEQAVAMATEAYARVKQDLAVSVVTTGPGCTNAISGIAGSWMDSVPHLVLSGQAFVSQTIGDSGLRQLGVQEINIIDLIKPITKYAVMLTDAASIKYHLQKAIHLATTGRPGPVWLDLPADMQNARIDENSLEGFSPDECPVGDDDLHEKVSQVIDILKSSKRPLVHAGQGIRLAGAVDDFMQFVETHRFPFVTARNANDMVDSSHKLYVGRPGTFAQRGANFAVQNADAYLAIGTRLSLPQTGYNAKDFARNATRIMVDIDRAELDKKTLDLHLKIHADAKQFLTELNRQMAGVSIHVDGWIERCRAWQEKYPVVLPSYYEQKGSVNSYVLIDVLSDLLSPEDIVVTDMGFAFQNTHQAFRVKKGQRMFTNCGFSSMGWGLPAAIGACFAHRRKRIICLAGDGGLMMTIQELATVQHYQLPIKLFILNNGGYVTIKQTQELTFDGRRMGVNADTGLSFPDMLKVADAHGIPAVRLETQENIQQRVGEVLSQPGPFICEIMMDHDQEQIPKIISKRQPDGRMLQTPLEDLYPFLDRKELEENMLN
ncbi:MAG TPA: thiamine pyrophosphate-binding protein [Nitrospirales bacterium]|nr:thiamine pyrophosphate-binding protein [Nitrospirales bacterium]HIC05239.1 thiamine pyrophosphate-binding protein [Nitrospirales bacterium]HIO21152.1 thiamine pyrophosphate-binding protein [Nitrospirales bacterium]HIO70060.1 thiamine pyrophosphate-binding protein [Nitrospirales bacterium]